MNLLEPPESEIWSKEIPFFILEKITGFLPFEDALHARLVCSSWNDAVKNTIPPFLVDLEMFLDDLRHFTNEERKNLPKKRFSYFCRLNVDYLFTKEQGLVSSYLGCKWPSYVRVWGIDLDLSSSRVLEKLVESKAFNEMVQWLSYLRARGHLESLYSLTLSSMDASEISTTDFSIFLRLFEEVSVFNLHDVLGLNSECIWPFLSRVIKSARCERVDFIGCYISNEPGDDLFNPLEHIMDIPQRRVSLDFTDSPATSVTTQHIIDYAKSWVDSEFPLVFETIRLHYRFGEQALDLSQFCRLHCSLCRWNGNFGEQYHVHSFTHRKYKSLIINIGQDESSILLGCYMKVCSHNLNIQHDDTGRFKISSDGRVALHARTVSRHDAIYATIDKKRLLVDSNEIELVVVKWDHVESEIPFTRKAIINVEFEWIELCPGMEKLFRWEWFASRSYHMSSFPHHLNFKSFCIEVENQESEKLVESLKL